MPEQRLQRWTDVALKREGGTEIWRQNPKYCLDAMDFRNGEPAQAWECSKKYLEHQIWRTL